VAGEPLPVEVKPTLPEPCVGVGVRVGVLTGVDVGVRVAVGVFVGAVGAHREGRHGGGGTVVGQCRDDREARTAVRAVDERVAKPAVSGVEQLREALLAGGAVRRHRGIGLSGPAGGTLSGPVATFTDPAPEPTSSYSATIDWGDGSSSPGTISGSLSLAWLDRPRLAAHLIGVIDLGVAEPLDRPGLWGDTRRQASHPPLSCSP